MKPTYFVIAYLILCFSTVQLLYSQDISNSFAHILPHKSNDVSCTSKNDNFGADSIKQFWQIGLVYAPTLRTIIATDAPDFWDYNSQMANGIGANFQFWYNNRIGVSSGIHFKQGKILNQMKERNVFYLESSIDMDGDIFYKGYDFELKEKLAFKRIDIPLLLSVRIFTLAKISLIFKGGGVFSFYQNPEISVNGVVNYKGLYTDYNVVLENQPDFGFVITPDFKNEYNWEISSTIISAFADLGISVPIVSKFSIVAGINGSFGVTSFTSVQPRHEYDSMHFYSSTNSKYSINEMGVYFGGHYAF